MPQPGDYWSTYEHSVTTLTEFLESVETISAYQAETGARFVWRGASDAAWGLHSRLFRLYIEMYGTIPMEQQLRNLEQAIIQEARDWGLDWHDTGGRLTALELLARLQHYGVPTRLLDFTFNPLIALWFAVEDEGAQDGRVFAIDSSDRNLTRERAAEPEPWWFLISTRADTEWTKEPWTWRPPPIESRIARQEGCFVMGGVPSTQPMRSLRDHGRLRLMRADEVRAAMSIPFRLIWYEQAVAAREGRALAGTAPVARAFTLRIRNKPDLRQGLEQGFGYSRRSLFPDLAGFAAFGRSFALPPGRDRRALRRNLTGLFRAQAVSKV